VSPIGPIRFDIGIRLPGFQSPVLDANDGDLSEGDPDTFFGLPIVLNLVLGEAF
jgi:hypothetical protein